MWDIGMDQIFSTYCSVVVVGIAVVGARNSVQVELILDSSYLGRVRASGHLVRKAQKPNGAHARTDRVTNSGGDIGRLNNGGADVLVVIILKWLCGEIEMKKKNKISNCKSNKAATEADCKNVDFYDLSYGKVVKNRMWDIGMDQIFSTYCSVVVVGIAVVGARNSVQVELILDSSYLGRVRASGHLVREAQKPNGAHARTDRVTNSGGDIGRLNNGGADVLVVIILKCYY
nr:hypothetical protein [Tanacetum cinerariifolium]